MLLTLVTFLPVVGALLVLVTPRGRDETVKAIAFLTSLVTFAVSLPLYLGFNPATANYQFVERRSWMPSLGVSYHLGIDGISLLLVLLTTFLMPLTLLSAWHTIESRLKEFAITMLLLETGMLGVFVALDLFLFYVFWEAMLIPMYLIIGIWGGVNRVYAAVKFILYTLGRVAPHAGGHPRPLLPPRRGHRHVHLRPARARPVRPARRALPGPPVPGLRPGVRHQGADVPVSHLAPRRPHRGADAGQRHPGRGAAEDGDLRVPALLPAAVPGGEHPLRPVDLRAGRHRHHLRRVGLHGAGGHQAAGGVLEREPPRLRDARPLHADAAGAGGRRSSRW